MTATEQQALERIKEGAATPEDWRAAGPYMEAILKFTASLVPFWYPGNARTSKDRCGHPACQKFIGHGAYVVHDGQTYWHRTCHPMAKEALHV